MENYYFILKVKNFNFEYMKKNNLKSKEKEIEILTSLLEQKEEEIRNLKQSNWYFAKEKAKLEEKIKNGKKK